MNTQIHTKPYWRVEEIPERVTRRVLMIPGVGYTCDRPLLSWTAAVAHQHGWWVQRAWWSVRPESNDDRFIARALGQLDREAPAAERTLVVGKSMGTRAAGAASARGWAGLWLTPLLTDPGVRRALLDSTGPCLAVGGSADPHWDPPAGVDMVRVDRDGRLGEPGTVPVRWVQVGDAGHSLEVPGDWRASLAVQRSVLELVDGFIASLTR